MPEKNWAPTRDRIAAVVLCSGMGAMKLILYPLYISDQWLHFESNAWQKVTGTKILQIMKECWMENTRKLC